MVGVWDGNRWDPSHPFRISSHQEVYCNSAPLFIFVKLEIVTAGETERPITLNYPLRSNRLQDFGNSCSAEWNVRWAASGANDYMVGSRVQPPLLHAHGIFSAQFMFTATAYNPSHMLHQVPKLQYLAAQIYIRLQGQNNHWIIALDLCRFYKSTNTVY